MAAPESEIAIDNPESQDGSSFFFLDKTFADDFANAIRHVITIFDSHGMLVPDPVKEMSHAAKVMGESFIGAILGVITCNENVIVSDEDLILHEESDINYV
jgi:hypothetical protein